MFGLPISKNTFLDYQQAQVLVCRHSPTCGTGKSFIPDMWQVSDADGGSCCYHWLARICPALTVL